MSDRPVQLAEISKDHALVHFFALMGAIEDIDLLMRLLASGIASFLSMDAVALGFNAEGNSLKIRVWHGGADSEFQSTHSHSESIDACMARAINDFHYPLQKSFTLVHLGKKIGCLAVARQEPVQLTRDEEFLLTSLQTLTSLLLAKHGADEALRHNREWLRVTLRSIGDAVMTTDAEGRVTFLNPVAEVLTGWSTEEALGKPIQQVFRIINEHSGEPAKDIVQAALRERSVVALANDTALLAKSGIRVPIEDSAAPIRDASGNISGVVVVFHDVTERRRTQEELRQSEQRVRLKLESILSPEGDVGNLEMADVIDTPGLQVLMDQFYELTHMPIGIIDMKGKVLVGVGWQNVCTKFHRVNPESCKHCIESDVELSVGIPAGEFRLYHCKNNMWDVATPITVGGKHVGNLFSGQFFFEGEPLDYELFRKQARKYGFEETEYLAALEQVGRLKRETVSTGMTYLAKLAEMISKLSYSNVKLARSLAERQRAQEEVNRRNRVLDGINRIFQEALKCETEEELGQTCLEVAAEITGSKFGFIAEIGADGLLHALAISDPGWELCALHDKAGERRRPGSFKIHGLYGRVLLDGKSLLTNAPAQHADSIGTPAGHPPLTAFLGVPLFDANRVVGIVAVGNREGGYRQEELETLETLAPALLEALQRKRTEQALIRSEKLVSVGRLAATIAHEINNPLEAATNALFLVSKDAALSGQSREMAEIADRELQRAAQIARRTLGFYREPNSRMSVVLADLFEELGALYETQMKNKGIRLRVRCGDESAAVIGNNGELRQLFSNLLANSIDAAPAGGTVHVRVGRRSMVTGTPTLRITVADSGGGIEKQNMKRIFEPFFTTKKDVGTGLGLWVSEQIVKKHGGTIRLRSRVGRGTVFSVRLPAAVALAARAGK